MAKNNAAIQALISSGADAMKNMYDVYIFWPWDSATADKGPSVRATGFNIPEPTVGSYERQYHGTKMSVPNTSAEFAREFEVTFRWDATYAQYQEFTTWYMAVTDPVSGGVANWPALTGKVQVEGLSGAYSAVAPQSNYFKGEAQLDTSTWNGGNNPIWTFEDAWVCGVSQPQFSTDSGEALEYTVKFKFGNCTYPFFNSTDIKGGESPVNV